MAAIDVEELVDLRTFGAFQLKIVILCLLVQVIDGFDNQAIAFVAPAITREWHVSRDALGPVFGAGAFGTLLGSLSMGPLGDWVGRKKLMVGSLALIVVLMLATAQATTTNGLLVLRFLAGFPLGALIPSTIVMANEWSPRRSRAAMVTIMACGFALGAALGGLLAAFLLPRLGWASVFYAGAIGTGLLGAALVPLMPESLRFLALRPTPARRAHVATILRRFDPSLVIDDAPTLVPPSRTAGANVIVELFRDGRAAITLLLWLSFFMNMLVMNFLNNWLPTLLSEAGFALDQAVRTTTLFQIGGIAGVVLMGSIADRVGVWRLIGTGYLLSGMMVAAIGVLQGGSLPLAVGLSGFCVIGVQMSLSAVSATLYPTAIRSTGSSWALGIGRIGSTAGPLLGGVLIGWHWPMPELLGTIALFSAAGFIVVLVLARMVTRPVSFSTNVKKKAVLF